VAELVGEDGDRVGDAQLDGVGLDQDVRLAAIRIDLPVISSMTVFC
jgi:hypothetical protein